MGFSWDEHKINVVPLKAESNTNVMYSGIYLVILKMPMNYQNIKS